MNSVVAVTTSSLPGRSIEKHLNWLLGDAETRQLPAGVHLTLTDPDVAARRGARLKKVRSIEIKADVPVEAGQGGARLGTHPGQITGQPVGRSWEALMTLLGSVGAEDLPDLDFSGNLRPGDLCFKLTVWNARRRNTIEGDTPVIDPIANALRHAEGVDMTVGFRDGTSVTGRELRLTDRQGVPCVNGIPDTTAVFERMHNWLETLAQRTDIQLD